MLYMGKIILKDDCYSEFLMHWLNKYKIQQYKPYLIDDDNYKPISKNTAGAIDDNYCAIEAYSDIANALYISYDDVGIVGKMFLRFSASSMFGVIVISFYPFNTNENGNVEYLLAENYRINAPYEWEVEWNYRELTDFIEEYINGKVFNPMQGIVTNH